jgi:ADP-dependent phosphofructokinase/glucokinase
VGEASETNGDDPTGWRSLYAVTAADLPRLAAAAPLLLAGMGACVDAVVPLAELAKLDLHRAPPEAAKLVSTLSARAAEGIGGEIRFDWAQGPTWLRSHLPLRLALGGTAPQAAWALSVLGAPILLALADRSETMLSVLPNGVGLASGGRICRPNELAPANEPRPEIFIFEFTAGSSIGAIVPPRSSRVITRFADLGLEHDAEFVALSSRLAGGAGAALISGFSAVDFAQIDFELDAVRGMVGEWRAAGLKTIHLELATYADMRVLRKVLAAVPGAFTSLGMSESEFVVQAAGTEATPIAMADFVERLGVDRLCVHADGWAAAVTRNNPETERRALLCGCLLAASRAAGGRPAASPSLPVGAKFAALPFAETLALGAWNFVAVASPYIVAPASTLGLGDTFTAGCLLVLGHRSGADRISATGRLGGATKCILKSATSAARPPSSPAPGVASAWPRPRP